MINAIASYQEVIKNIKNTLSIEPAKIKELKDLFIKSQKFEEAASIREIERVLELLLQKIDAAIIIP